jgi:hypothetical protein
MSIPRGGRVFAGAACTAEPRCARSFFGIILCSAAGWGLHNGQFASPAGGHGQIVCNDVIGTLWRASLGHDAKPYPMDQALVLGGILTLNARRCPAVFSAA